MNRSKIHALLLASAVLLPPLARADIIDSIEELDKKPQKKPATETKDTPKTKPQPTVPTAVPEVPLQVPEPLPPIPAQTVRPPSKPKDPKETAKIRERRKNAPIHLSSDGTSTYSKGGSTVTLQKNVSITQDDMRLQSNEAKVLLGEGGGTENSVKSAELNGSVAISRYSDDPTERMNAKSDRATFDNLTQVVTLIGNARLWREGSLIKGERIVYEIASGMIKVERAQGVVQPDRVKKND